MLTCAHTRRYGNGITATMKSACLAIIGALLFAQPLFAQEERQVLMGTMEHLGMDSEQLRHWLP